MPDKGKEAFIQHSSIIFGNRVGNCACLIRLIGKDGSIMKLMEVACLLKWIIQIAFVLIGGTLGLLFLPHLYELFNLSNNPWIHNPYVSVLIGAILLYVAALFYDRLLD